MKKPLLSPTSQDPPRECIWLDDASGVFRVEGVPQRLRVSSTIGLEYGPLGRGLEHVMRMEDIVGSRLHSTSTSTTQLDGSEVHGGMMEVFSYPRSQPTCMAFMTNDTKRMRRVAKHVVFTTTDRKVAEELDKTIKKLVLTTLGYPDEVVMKRRRFLVFVNPVSGTRRSLTTYKKVVAAMLQQADIEHKHVVTERMHHARDFVAGLSEEELKGYDAIIAMGGDGLLFEVVNGLYVRDKDGLSYLKSVPVSIIKGGTGNGLSTTILHSNGESLDELSSIFVAVKGRPKPTDLSLVHTKSNTQHLSFLMMSWGMISDVDIESERFRSLGIFRNTIYSLLCIMRLRRYPGRLSFLPAETSSGGGDGNKRTNPHGSVAMPPLSEPLPTNQGWVTIEGEFVMLLVSHVSHIAEGVHTSPGKAMGDGLFHIILIRKPVSRWKLLTLFAALEMGSHIEEEEVEVYWAHAYRLEPLTNQGIYSMDGEVIEYGPVQATMLPHAMQVLAETTPSCHPPFIKRPPTRDEDTREEIKEPDEDYFHL